MEQKRLQHRARTEQERLQHPARTKLNRGRTRAELNGGPNGTESGPTGDRTWPGKQRTTRASRQRAQLSRPCTTGGLVDTTTPPATSAVTARPWTPALARKVNTPPGDGPSTP
jgi:hypothetical protein